MSNLRYRAARLTDRDLLRMIERIRAGRQRGSAQLQKAEAEIFAACLEEAHARRLAP